MYVSATQSASLRRTWWTSSLAAGVAELGFEAGVKAQRLGPLCRDSNPISALKSNMRQRTSSAVSLCRTKSWIESACLHESSAESDNGPKFWRHTGDTSDLKRARRYCHRRRHAVRAALSTVRWRVAYDSHTIRLCASAKEEQKTRRDRLLSSATLDKTTSRTHGEGHRPQRERDRSRYPRRGFQAGGCPPKAARTGHARGKGHDG